MRLLPRFAAIPLALVLLAASPLPEVPEPDLAALGVPAYPGMVYRSGQVGAERTPDPEAQGPPALSGFLRYTTEDPFEAVVTFYEKAFGPSRVRVKPIDLTIGRRGQEIPESARGRRRLFQARSRPGAPEGPAPADPEKVMEHILHRALGATNVLVSDHAIDPESGAVQRRTTIEILLFR